MAFSDCEQAPVPEAEHWGQLRTSAQTLPSVQMGPALEQELRTVAERYKVLHSTCRVSATGKARWNQRDTLSGSNSSARPGTSILHEISLLNLPCRDLAPFLFCLAIDHWAGSGFTRWGRITQQVRPLSECAAARTGRRSTTLQSEIGLSGPRKLVRARRLPCGRPNEISRFILVFRRGRSIGRICVRRYRHRAPDSRWNTLCCFVRRLWHPDEPFAFQGMSGVFGKLPLA